MKKFDFIIGYEHKNREIESVCLLKYELERRGYKVFVYNIEDRRLKEHKKKYHAEVLLLPFVYDEVTLYGCALQAITYNKVINLQWEQAIYKSQEDNADSYRNPSGICKKVVHLSWGKANVNRLIQVAGMKEKYVKLVGNITLDFLKNPLSNYYMSREQVYNQYHIPSDKKVCLFIASFKSATENEQRIEKLCKVYGEWRRKHHEIAKKSMMIILEWIKTALETDPDLFFIYRPHPGEKTYIVDEIQRNNDRFVVIKDLSVKQWILVADKIYTWMSTTVAEVYVAQKSCYILYPFELPEEAQERLFDDMKAIIDYDSFYSSLKDKKKSFPIDRKILENYYLVDRNMSYIKVADTCEEVLKSEYYNLDKDELKRVYAMLSDKRITKKIRNFIWQIDCVYKLFWILIIKFPFKGAYFDKKRQQKVQDETWKITEFVSEAEIDKICCKIRSCLEKEVCDEKSMCDCSK